MYSNRNHRPLMNQNLKFVLFGNDFKKGMRLILFICRQYEVIMMTLITVFFFFFFLFSIVLEVCS